MILESDWDKKTVEMKGKMDGYFNLLKKTLPDLKAMEITGADGEDIKLGTKILVVEGVKAESQDT